MLICYYFLWRFCCFKLSESIPVRGVFALFVSCEKKEKKKKSVLIIITAARGDFDV